MMPQPTNPVEVFYSYAHEDEKLRDELKKHLANLKRQGVITEWYDRDISAGKEWDGEIESRLNSASVILLLISPDFMNSDYSNEVEVKRAMERHEAGEARVIPIILRPVDWEGAPFSKLQGLPTDAKAVTLWENYDEAFVSVVKGIRSALKEPTIRSANVLSHTNIPRPPVVGFVARRDSDGRDIVERLKEELAPQRNQLIALSGPGGVGKTTLAAEAARALSGSFGQRIVWTSALGREDFSLSTLLDDIATQLGQPGLRPLALEPKTAQVQTLIASRPTLIILDNFETIAEAEQSLCVEFLLNRAPCPALITTRQKVSSARSITISVMSSEEADTFLQLLIDQAGDASAFEGLDRSRIMKASERNPLVLQWVVAQIDLAQDADAVLEELAQGGGDAAQRVFDRSFGLEHLGEDGRASLLALSLFAPDASRAALAAVAGFGEDMKRLNEAVKRLAGLWLVKAATGGSRLTIQGLTRELAKARFANDERVGEYRQRFVAFFLGYAEANTEPEGYDLLQAEKDNLLNAIETGFGSENWKSVMLLATALGRINGFLDQRGYWDEAIKSNSHAAAAARTSNQKLDAAIYSHRIGLLKYRRGLYDEAREASEEALSIYRALGSKNNVAVALHQLAMLAHDQGKLDEARRLHNESLEISKGLGNQKNIAGGLHELARLAQAQGELDEARRLYNESLEIKKRLGDQGGIASSLHQLAQLGQDQGDFDEARRLYHESLEMNKRLGNQGGIATSLHQLATLAQSQGELEEARRLYNESLEIKKRLGNLDGIARTLGQLGSLEEDEGRNADAARLFGEALTIFEKLKSPYAEVARQSLERVKGKAS